MDYLLKRIIDLRESRGWSEYRLSEESGVAQSTMSAWYSGNKNVYPTVSSLMKISKAFNISLSRLFADDNSIEVSDIQLLEVVNLWERLDNPKRTVIIELLKVMLVNEY